MICCCCFSLAAAAMKIVFAKLDGSKEVWSAVVVGETISLLIFFLFLWVFYNNCSRSNSGSGGSCPGAVWPTKINVDQFVWCSSTTTEIIKIKKTPNPMLLTLPSLFVGWMADGRLSVVVGRDVCFIVKLGANADWGAGLVLLLLLSYCGVCYVDCGLLLGDGK